MNIAVVLAHPKHDSFNAAIARACVEHLAAMGHDVILRDLYAMDFDPCLKAIEIPGGHGYAVAPDTLAERERLAGIDGFVFVYPFWFNAPPAILKGYVDRVFGMGFGYTPHPGGNEPNLKGRKLLTFSTSGAPDHWVNSTGALRNLMAVFDLHLAGVCGLQVPDHKHFGGIVPDLSEEAVGDMLERVRADLEEAFPLPALAPAP